MAYTGWLAGQRITAGALNAMVGTTQTYTPTWTASTTNPVLGNGTLTGQYTLLGSTVHVNLKLTFGSTTTAGSGTYHFSLPPGLLNGSLASTGNLFIGDSSGGSGAYTAAALAFIAAGSDHVDGYTGAPTASTAMTAASPQTFANGDQIWITATYQTA